MWPVSRSTSTGAPCRSAQFCRCPLWRRVCLQVSAPSIGCHCWLVQVYWPASCSHWAASSTSWGTSMPRGGSAWPRSPSDSGSHFERPFSRATYACHAAAGHRGRHRVQPHVRLLPLPGGLSSQGSVVGRIGALAALLAWVAAAIGTGMMLRGVSPLGMPALLLATLPVVTAILLLREAATGRASPEPP